MNMKELGKMLREERLRQGLELSAVAAVTRISIPALAGLEEGNEAALPNPVYIKGFAKNYGKFLGLDAAVISSALSEIHFTDDHVAWTPVDQTPSTRTVGPVVSIILAVVALLVLAGGGAWFFQKPLFELFAPKTQNDSISQYQTQAQGPTAQDPDTFSLPQPADQFAPIPNQAGELPNTAPERTSGTRSDTTSGMTPETTPESTPEARAGTSPDAVLETSADQTEDATLTELKPEVQEDNDLGKAALGNVQISNADGGYQADFEISNLTDDVISGQISIFFITRNAETFPALREEDAPNFRIRNFRVVSATLQLPPGVAKEDLAAIQFVVTEAGGEDILIKAYPLQRLITMISEPLPWKVNQLSS